MLETDITRTAPSLRFKTATVLAPPVFKRRNCIFPTVQKTRNVSGRARYPELRFVFSALALSNHAPLPPTSPHCRCPHLPMQNPCEPGVKRQQRRVRRRTIVESVQDSAARRAHCRTLQVRLQEHGKLPRPPVTHPWTCKRWSSPPKDRERCAGPTSGAECGCVLSSARSRTYRSTAMSSAMVEV